ncbi:unnamed protein product [Caenorhabditis brenneri]
MNDYNNSNGSSPSPPTSSSLQQPTLPDAPEVKLEVEDTDEMDTTGAGGAGPSTSAALPTTQPQPPTDLATLIQSNPTFQALLASGSIGDDPSAAIARLFGAHPKGTPVAPGGAISPSATTADPPKKSRIKVFSNGYFMTFDKISSCQNKHFWRCEFKNTCKARMHTDINSDKIVTYIHEHNHKAPTAEEVRLYGLDPDNYEKNRVYIVGNNADPNQRRKIRKQVADAEAAAERLEQKKKEELQRQANLKTIAAAQAVYAQAMKQSSSAAAASSLLRAAAAPMLASPVAGAPVTSVASPMNHQMLLAQFPFLKQEMPTPPQMFLPSPNLAIPPIPALVIPKEEPTTSQPSLKRRAVEEPEDDSDWRRDPMFEPTFEIARKLRKLWKGEPNRYPRTTNTPSTYFEFYIAKYDGLDEHLYIPMRIETRDEAHLKEALQTFCGKQLYGMLLFGVSPKISVMFNQPMVSSWDNGQFFLLDTSNPSRWRLVYVDDQAKS